MVTKGGPGPAFRRSVLSLARLLRNRAPGRLDILACALDGLTGSNTEKRGGGQAENNDTGHGTSCVNHGRPTPRPRSGSLGNAAGCRFFIRLGLVLLEGGPQRREGHMELVAIGLGMDLEFGVELSRE